MKIMRVNGALNSIVEFETEYGIGRVSLRSVVGFGLFGGVECA